MECKECNNITFRATVLFVFIAGLLLIISAYWANENSTTQELKAVGEQFGCEYLQHNKDIAFYDCNGIIIIDRVK